MQQIVYAAAFNMADGSVKVLLFVAWLNQGSITVNLVVSRLNVTTTFGQHYTACRPNTTQRLVGCHASTSDAGAPVVMVLNVLTTSLYQYSACKQCG